MKRGISIAVVVLVVLGFSYFLYKISPQQTIPNSNEQFNVSDAVPVKEPREVGAGDYVLGNPLATNTFIVYEDFECPACANFSSEVLKAPNELKDTKVVFRHFPLPQHTNAPAAAFAAEAAGAQGKFWDIYEPLYKSQNDWSNLADPIPYLKTLAEQVGVKDMQKFSSDMATKIGKTKIEADMKEAIGLGVNATPTVYFNGQKLELGDIQKLKVQVEKLYK
jgi:protein-disulfide isomerase